MTVERFASVWDAIADTPQEAASMRIRADLMTALQSWIEAKGCTQSEAAKLFGVTQPRVSDLTRGRISLFSTDALIDMATAAGLRPKVTVHLTSKRVNPRTLAKRERKEVAKAA